MIVLLFTQHKEIPPPSPIPPLVLDGVVVGSPRHHPKKTNAIAKNREEIWKRTTISKNGIENSPRVFGDPQNGITRSGAQIRNG